MSSDNFDDLDDSDQETSERNFSEDIEKHLKLTKNVIEVYSKVGEVLKRGVPMDATYGDKWGIFRMNTSLIPEKSRSKEEPIRKSRFNKKPMQSLNYRTLLKTK